MPRSDGDADDLIREVLEEADEDLLDRREDRSAAALLTEAFRGRNRRLAIAGAVVNLVLFVAAVFSGIRFLGAGDAREAAVWGIAMLLWCGLLLSIKVWYWLEMNRLALAREIKRVELRVARIAATLGEGGEGPAERPRNDDALRTGRRSPPRGT